MNGLKRSAILGKRSRHLVLTTSDNPKVKSNPDQMYEDYRKLNQKIKRLTPLKLYRQGYLPLASIRKYYPNKRLNETLDYEYHRVRTNEINGVLHIVQVGDFLPYYWVKKQWKKLHYSPNISITEISNSHYGQRAKYVVTQYVSDQKTSYVRSSMSKNFIYPGWCQDYQMIKNSIYHYHFKGQHRKNKFSDWTTDFYSQSEWLTKLYSPPPSQTQLLPSEIPNDKALFVSTWENFLTEKLTGGGSSEISPSHPLSLTQTQLHL